MNARDIMPKRYEIPTEISTKKPKKTNFDRITESVESLAETVCKSGLCPFEYSVGVDCHKDGCKECIKGWLQKECEQ